MDRGAFRASKMSLTNLTFPLPFRCEVSRSAIPSSERSLLFSGKHSGAERASCLLLLPSAVIILRHHPTFWPSSLWGWGQRRGEDTHTYTHTTQWGRKSDQGYGGTEMLSVYLPFILPFICPFTRSFLSLFSSDTYFSSPDPQPPPHRGLKTEHQGREASKQMGTNQRREECWMSNIWVILPGHDARQATCERSKYFQQIQSAAHHVHFCWDGGKRWLKTNMA